MHRTEGIIISSEKIGESDSLCSIFTKEYGKLKVVAQGVRKIDSKLRAILQPGHHISFHFLPLRSGRYRLTSPTLINSFAGIRSNSEKLATHLYLLSVFDSIVFEESKDDGLWDLLLQWSGELSELLEAGNASSLRFWFLSHLLFCLGFSSPNMNTPKALAEYSSCEVSESEKEKLREGYAVFLQFSKVFL